MKYAWLKADKNSSELELRVKLRVVAHINESSAKEALNIEKAAQIERFNRAELRWLSLHT